MKKVFRNKIVYPLLFLVLLTGCVAKENNYRKNNQAINVKEEIILDKIQDSGTNQNISNKQEEKEEQKVIQSVETIEKTNIEIIDESEVNQNISSKQEREASNACTKKLSNDNYYTNSDGEEVHSPAFALSKPSGATAKCRDGTYSFSRSRRGTCSHHGGVAIWY